jgi:nucleoside phosphorylase
MSLTIEQLAELAKELNRLYDKREAADIAWAATIPDGHVDFDGPGRTVWLRIVRQADVVGDHAVRRLVEHALGGYDRPLLRELLAAAEASEEPDVAALATAIVVGALSLEVEAMRRQLSNVREESHPRFETLAYVGQLDGRHARWRVGVVCSQQTSADAGVIAERAIEWFSPDVALFVGVAGGLKDVKAGDVVAGDTVQDVECGKDTTEGYQARPREFRGSHGLVQRAAFTAVTNDWHERIRPADCESPFDGQPEVHIEPIACGMKVLANTESAIYENVRRAAPRAVAIEMEGAGFSAAIDKSLGVRGMVIRGVSDMLKDKGDPLDGCRQQHAAARAAAFAAQVLHDMQLRD